MRRGSRCDERFRRGEWLLLISGLCLAMLLPYLPGGYDASAAALSVVAQVASLVSVLLVPVIIVDGGLSVGCDYMTSMRWVPGGPIVGVLILTASVPY